MTTETENNKFQEAMDAVNAHATDEQIVLAGFALRAADS